eukprot:gene14659-19694_t
MSIETEDHEWKEMYSESKKRKYWYNSKSGKSVWELPISISENSAEDCSSSISTTNDNKRSRKNDLSTQKNVEASKELWTEFFSESKQKKYWYNSMTQESVWNCPFSNDLKRTEVNVLYTKASSIISVPIQEDSPLLAIERDKLCEDCLTLFVTENSIYGKMKGYTKTARACNTDGMRIGLQGIFARILWSQLLHQVLTLGDVGTISRDGVFPSIICEDEAVIKEFIEFGRTFQQSTDIIKKLTDSLIFANNHILNMRNNSDLFHTHNIELSENKNHQNNNHKSYLLIYHNKNKSFTISEQHLLKILTLYRLHTDDSASFDNPLFLRRLFCVIARYETLSGNSDGYQMAFPNNGFQWLRDKLAVTVECFASPLNCWNQRFCSVARDTDRFFGSLGNFFLFEGHTGKLGFDNFGLELGGSFEANPPFVESIMNQMAYRIEYLLNTFSNAPFSFVVIVPAWVDCEGVILMSSTKYGRPHQGFRLVLEKKQHNYRPGMQHRTAHDEQPSNVDTLVFFIQNDLGAEKWPVTLNDTEELKELLRPR